MNLISTENVKKMESHKESAKTLVYRTTNQAVGMVFQIDTSCFFMHLLIPLMWAFQAFYDSFQPPPTLPKGKFSDEFVDFVDRW